MITGVNPYIVTNGNGQEAVKFYQEALEAELLGIQTFDDMPDNPDYPLPPEAKDRVLHAHLKVGSNDIMLSDTFPGQPHELGNQVTVVVSVSDTHHAHTIFEKLQEGGKVDMNLQETFWSPAYGQVTDKFGISWQISTNAAE
ncbi:VOC family protein [Thalassobacillus devorans]|uniref:VOC family protein n=1 Tax=Thalassobacillus devorans TaxID=279813 RepID=A0ABQ1NJN6_9BACI|nr:VOC family protein [Thalassobacillus devorans]NIK27576.1 PhnB protein [Thalassobacillus devorans]GGC78843.1 VOC family protein [Thalassobacillus devorans]